jgi:hypothetical protein
MGTSTTETRTQQAVPTLVGIRAAHHPAYDRVVFDFVGGLPAGHEVRYVPALIADGSGLPIPVMARAILQVRFQPAQAHENGTATVPERIAFALPNVITAVRAGDAEGVTTYGIGLAQEQPFTVLALADPDRIVVDVAAAFPTTTRQVWFSDTTGGGGQWRAVPRQVLPLTPATGVMDRLFAGPTEEEKAQGLEFVASEATGYTGLTISQRIARVRLTGGCDAHGSTISIAGEVFPALKQFSTVDWVKIYDPQGNTESPAGNVDSIPVGLEP